MSAKRPHEPVTPAEAAHMVRDRVRAQKAYHVGSAPDIRVKLNQNESPYDLPQDLKRELVEAWMEVPFNRYPPEAPVQLRDAIADHAGHPADGVIVGNGSNEMSFTLGLTLIGDGAPVVLPRPLFAFYGTMVRLHGGVPIEIPCRPDLSFDVDGLEEAVVRERPALTIVATPNNPTGLALRIDEIERLATASAGILLVDEAYVEFNPYGTALGLVSRHPNVIIMRTLSKAFGLAGLRVGYLLGHPELIGELMKARIPFMVGPIAQAAALALLARPSLVADRIEAIRRDTADLTRALARMPGLEVVETMTNFVLFRPREPVPGLFARLADAGVLVRDMGGYPELAGFLRVSGGTPGENRDFLTALQGVLGAEGP